MVQTFVLAKCVPLIGFYRLFSVVLSFEIDCKRSQSSHKTEIVFKITVNIAIVRPISELSKFAYNIEPYHLSAAMMFDCCMFVYDSLLFAVALVRNRIKLFEMVVCLTIFKTEQVSLKQIILLIQAFNHYEPPSFQRLPS